MNAIVNTKIILEDGLIFNGTILYEKDIITAYGESSEITVPSGTKVIDAGGKYTAPGFVDIHNHGGGGYWFHNQPEEAAKHFLKHGQTTILATIYFNLDYEQTMNAINTIRDAREKGVARIIKGLYMEGPYMNPKYGSDNKNLKWKNVISADEFVPIVDNAGDFVKVWCIAPERENIEEFCKYAKKVNPSVVFSIGHSIAGDKEIFKLKHYGLINQTHHLNSVPVSGKYVGSKGVANDEVCLYDEGIYAELICDYNGIHVQPFQLRLTAKIKGIDKIILITDSCPFEGKNSEKVAYGPDLGYDSDGNLAGSKLTMDNACRNMMRHSGYGLCHVIKFATANPAKMVGIFDEVGSIDVGKKANLIIIDDMINVEKVIFEGEEMAI